MYALKAMFPVFYIRSKSMLSKAKCVNGQQLNHEGDFPIGGRDNGLCAS